MSIPLGSSSLPSPHINHSNLTAMGDLALGILKFGSVDITNSEGETLLHLAVRTNDHVLATRLIAMKADVNRSNFVNITPLQAAAGCPDERMCKLLVDAKADVNKAGAFNETPIHKALDLGLRCNIVYLINNGADMNAPSCWNKSAKQRCTSFFSK